MAISCDDGSSNWALVTQGKDLDGDHGTWLGPNLVLAIAGIGVVDQLHGNSALFLSLSLSDRIKTRNNFTGGPPGSNKMHKFEQHGTCSFFQWVACQTCRNDPATLGARGDVSPGMRLTPQGPGLCGLTTQTVPTQKDHRVCFGDSTFLQKAAKSVQKRLPLQRHVTKLIP